MIPNQDPPPPTAGVLPDLPVRDQVVLGGNHESARFYANTGIPTTLNGVLIFVLREEISHDVRPEDSNHLHRSRAELVQKTNQKGAAEDAKADRQHGNKPDDGENCAGNALSAIESFGRGLG